MIKSGKDNKHAIYKAKVTDFAEIVDKMNEAVTTGVELNAMKIKLKVNHFYRASDYVNNLKLTFILYIIFKVCFY